MRWLGCVILLFLTSCNGADLQCDDPSATGDIIQIAKDTLRFQSPLFTTAFRAARLPDTTITNVMPITADIRNLGNALGRAEMDCTQEKFTASMPTNALCGYFHKSKTADELIKNAGTLSASDIAYYNAKFLRLHTALREAQQRYSEASKANEDASVSQMREFVNSLNYSVDTIRLLDRDQTSGAISCAAKLRLTTQAGSWSSDVTYSVQRTTDGKIYVEIHRP